MPKNLRINKLTSRFSAGHIEGFHRDKVYFVLSSINAQMRYLNKKGCFPGEQKPYYVPLSSDILKSVIGNNYKKVIEWMLHARIMITDGHFKKGKRCMHYRLTPKYLGSPSRWVTVTCKSLKNKQSQPSWSMAPKAVNYLAKWLTPEHLTVDVEAAKKVLEYERFKK